MAQEGLFRPYGEYNLDSYKMRMFVYQIGACNSYLYFCKPSNGIAESTFAISFRTPPTDSSGVQHIIEHSVLCGSKLYQAKEPFVNLMQSSLNTYLNAFTSTEHTTYPVASCCYKDYLNLVSVYLDAVFNPLSVEDPGPFQQEGWHLHLENLDEELRYQGIVLNEMKGLFSDPDSYAATVAQQCMFNNSSLGHESGGDPCQIVKLTYKQYCDYYRLHYHLDNCILVVISEHDQNQLLAELSNMLRRYIGIRGQPQRSKFDEIQPVPEKTIQISCKQEDQADYSMMRGCIGKPIGVIEPLEYYLVELIDTLIHDAPGNPFTKQLLEEGLCEGFSSEYDDQQGYSFTIQKITNFNPDQKEMILAKISEIYNSLIESDEYLTEDLVKQALNSELIEYKNNGDEWNINFADNILKFALNGVSAERVQDIFDYEKHLQRIQDMPWPTLREELRRVIRTNFLHSSTVVLLEPKVGLMVERENAERSQLDLQKRQMSQAQLEAVLKSTRRILDRQKRDDTAEGLASIPKLQLSDLAGVVDGIKKLTFAEVCGQFYHAKTMEDLIIFQICLFPDVNSVEEIHQLSLLCELLGQVQTTNHCVSQLQKNIMSVTSGYTFSVGSYANDLVIECSFCCLGGKVGDAVRLFAEIFSNSQFSDHKQIYGLLKESRASIKLGLDGEEAYDAIQNLSTGQFEISGVINDMVDGFAQLEYLNQLFCDECSEEDEEDEESDLNVPDRVLDLIEQLHIMLGKITSAMVFVSCSEEDLQRVSEAVNVLPQASNLSITTAKPSQPQLTRIIKLHQPSAIKSQQSVNYVTKSMKVDRLTPELLLVASILTNKYLWNNVRVLGGAYGCTLSVSLTNTILVSSYWDPHYEETLKIYDNCGQYLRQLEINDDQLVQMKIGAIGAHQPPRTQEGQLSQALEYFMLGINALDFHQMVEGIQHVTINGIREQAKVLEHLKTERDVSIISAKQSDP